MSGGELRKFEREFIAEHIDKDALIVDVRFNGGGLIHEQLFDLLDRHHFGYSAKRDQPLTVQPSQAFDKPAALLINQRSASDAEIFPSGWRILGLGPVVGVDTYGAVIGTGGYRLIDGSSIRMPHYGWYDINMRNLELAGTPPDYYVEVHPDDLRNGVDAQLDKALELMLAELDGE
jgi:tricorn protease